MRIVAPPRPPHPDNDAEALIEEARRRARRRRAAYGMAFLLVAAAFGLYFGIGGGGGGKEHTARAPKPAAPSPGQEARRIIEAGARTAIGEAGLVAPDLGWAMNGVGLWWTRDGGARWRVMTPPQVASTGDVVARVVDIAAVDDQHVWVSAADIEGDRVVNGSTRHMAIERTRDGGKTWQASIPPGCDGCAGARVSFVDARTGFASVLAPPSRRRLFATHDGGASWRRVSNDLAFAGPIVFLNTREGWAVSDPGRLVGPAQSVPIGGGTVYRTRDGGRHWRPVKLAAPAAYEGEPATGSLPRFFGTNGVVAVRFRDRTRAQHLVVYVTTNGGDSWTAHPAPLSADLRAYSWGFPEALPFSAATADSWFLFVGHNLYSTRDAGRTWSITQTVAPKAPRVWDVNFTSPRDGWAIFAPLGARPRTGPALVKTTDRGRHWTPLAPQTSAN